MHFFAAVMVPFYTDWGGLKLSQILFLNSWFMLWNFILEVPTGTIADFLGRKFSLALGCVMAAGAALLYVSQPNFYIFLAAEFVFAIAYTLHSGADEALAYDSLKVIGAETTSKSVLSAMESFKLAGIIIATITGGFIASQFGPDTTMKAYAIPACIAFLLAMSLKEPPPENEIVEKKYYFKILRDGTAVFTSNKILLILTLELSLTNAFAWGIIWLFQPLLTAAGLAIKYFGIVHALSALGQIILLSNLQRVESWIGSKRKLLLIMAMTAGLAFISLAFVKSIFAVAFAIIVSFTFSLPRIPIFSSYMNKFIPSDKRATILSLTSMLRTLAIVIINPIIGFLADWSIFYTMMILGGLILFSTFFSRIEEKHLID